MRQEDKAAEGGGSAIAERHGGCERGKRGVVSTKRRERSPEVAKHILLPCREPKQALSPLLLASKLHSSGLARPLSIWLHTLSRAFRRRFESFEAALLSTDNHLMACLRA